MKENIVLMKASHGSVLGMKDDNVEGWEKLDWVVISEPVEVDFPDLPKDVVVKKQIAVVKKQIAVLDKQITKNLTECATKNNQLIARKQELLAITHEGE